MNTKFFRITSLIAILIFFASCDKNYNDIGSNIVGDDHFGFLLNNTTNVTAYTQKTGAIQSNNLDINPLGVFSSPNFGTTTASFATQLQLATVAPTIDLTLSQQIQSVVLYVPYFNKLTSTNADGSHTYNLDSIVGNKSNGFKLGIYENGYEIRDYDLANQEFQRFYTDQKPLFENNKMMLLNDDTGSFKFSNIEYSVTTPASGTTPASTTYTPPGMQITLNSSYFQSKMFTNPSVNLLNNNVFKDYFKGLYFKAEQIGTDQVLAMLNFKKGVITIKYQEKTSSTDATMVNKSILLNLSGNTVSLLNNDFGTTGITYGSLPNTGNTTTGDDKLFLKGGEGSVGMISLFGTTDAKGYSTTTGVFTNIPNGVPDELDDIRSKGWLINEANLTFYIDQASMSDTNSPDPYRLFLFDARNKRAILDYYYDNTTSQYVNSSKYIHDGIIDNKNITGKGTKYKIRITNYIRNLVKFTDSTNVKMGIAVTQSISNPNFVKIKTTAAPVTNAMFFPTASVMNPLGTVIWGNTAIVPEDKKLKLEIWYTKPD